MDARPRATGTAILLLMLAWASLVLAVYFRNAWTLLTGAEGPWAWPEMGQTLRFAGLPHWEAAVARAGVGLAAASTCALAAFGTGALIARRLPAASSFTEWLLLRIAFGAGALGCALYALAGLGLYTADTVRGTIVVLAGAGLTVTVLARRAGAPAPKLSPRGDWPWVFVTVGAVCYAGFCALAPEIEYDALWYHLELPRRWLSAGRPVDDINEYVSLYPLGWDLLFGAALALDGPVAAKLLHWMALPACAGTAAVIARAVSAHASPWMAAAIFATAPTVFWEATTAYIDLALAFFVGIAIWALLRAHATGDRRWLIVAGLQLGFACAAKHLGLVAVASVLPVLAWSRLGARSFREAFRVTAMVALLALLVPAPWYLRAWNASGNPVFPDMYSVFGTEPAARWDRLTERGLQKFKDHFGRPRTVASTLLLPWDMTMHGSEYGGTLGPLLLAGLPLMGLAAVARRPAAALGGGVVLYVIVWASPLSSFQLRFLVPVWVPCAALLAAGLGLVLRRLRSTPVRAAVRASLGAILLLCLPPWTILHEGDRRGWDGWLTHVVHEPPTAVVLGGISEDAWLRAQVRTFGAWQWLSRNAPPGTRVLTFFSGDQLYSDRARIWSEAVNARAATWGATAGDRTDTLRELRRLGIAFVLAPAEPWKTAEHRRLDLLRPDVMGPALEGVYEDRFAVVYAVRADAAAAAGTTDHSYGR